MTRLLGGIAVFLILAFAIVPSTGPRRELSGNVPQRRFSVPSGNPGNIPYALELGPGPAERFASGGLRLPRRSR